MSELLGLVTLVFVGVVFLALFKKWTVSNSVRDEFNYQRSPYLLTKAELSFYGVLKRAVGDTGVVFAKVRVADVLNPAKGQNGSARQIAQNKINAKHFDFVVCEPNGSTIRLAIELDDSSHSANKRVRRDEFLNNACRSAALPLLRVNAAAGYVVEDIRKLLAQVFTEQPSRDITRAHRVTERAEPTFSG